MSRLHIIMSMMETVLSPLLVGVAQLHVGTPPFEAETKEC